MNATLLIALRVIHIFFGVFWAGTIFFMMGFLQPAVKRMGPEGGQVMQALAKRGYLTAMPVIALLTVLAGIGLMWMVSGGFSPEWMGSPTGITLSTGGLVAVIALFVGVFVMRPTALKAGAVGGRLAQATDPAEQQALAGELASLQKRMATGLHAVTMLLTVAVLAMAVGRYL